MNDYLKNIMKTAETAAAEANSIILQYFNKAKIEEKDAGNLVTEADLKSEKAVRDIITAAFPDHSILGEEEGGEADMNADHLWLIDPLDGTNNYAHGFPFFSISIAYAEKGEVLAGIVADPLKAEIFSAVKGGGAKLNGEPIRPTDRRLKDSLISVGFYYDRGSMMRSTLKSIEKLFEHGIHGIRRLGSAALDFCYVASGRTDGYFEYQLNPWDFAAGMLILSEAGGDCRDTDGRPLLLTSKTFAASNGTITDQFIGIIRRRED